MDKKEIIDHLIYPAVDETNETLAAGKQLVKSPETPLFGHDSVLDSLGLVNLVVLTEERIEQKTGKPIRLVSEMALSRRKSPFRSIQALSEYIEELMKESGPQDG